MKTVEWAPFMIIEDVNEAELLKRAEEVQIQMIGCANGFIRRELVRKSAREYADILHWASREDAVAISEKVMESDVCKAYFALMDGNVEADGGFSHYDVVKAWSTDH